MPHLTQEPLAVAARGPILWFGNQAALYRIAVEVAELLNELGVCKDIEIVVAGLPALFAVALKLFRRFAFKNAQRGLEPLLPRLAE